MELTKVGLELFSAHFCQRCDASSASSRSCSLIIVTDGGSVKHDGSVVVCVNLRISETLSFYGI